jgi:hypothetical protein
VPEGLLSCSILHANKYAVLETLKSLDVPMPECNGLMNSTDVTEMDLQLSQPSCIVLSVPEMVEDEVIPFKKARLEKKRIVVNLPERIVKWVTFDLPIITENN